MHINAECEKPIHQISLGNIQDHSLEKAFYSWVCQIKKVFSGNQSWFAREFPFFASMNFPSEPWVSPEISQRKNIFDDRGLTLIVGKISNYIQFYSLQNFHHYIPIRSPRYPNFMITRSGVEPLPPRRLSFVGMSINDVWQAIQEEEPC